MQLLGSLLAGGHWTKNFDGSIFVGRLLAQGSHVKTGGALNTMKGAEPEKCRTFFYLSLRFIPSKHEVWNPTREEAQFIISK